MTDPARINGNAYGWSSISTKAGGEPFVGIKSIEYSDSRERELVYGQNRAHAPIGSTPGKYTPDPGKIVVWKHASEAFDAKLAQIAGSSSIGNAVFPIVVQYVEGTGAPITDTLRRCKVTKKSTKPSESASAVEVEYELQYEEIDWNGRQLFDSTEAS